MRLHLSESSRGAHQDLTAWISSSYTEYARLTLSQPLRRNQPGILQIGKPFAHFRSTMKDGIANNSTASISHARKAVEQLKMEACMDRIKVSKAAADLMAYCDAHIREDPLIMPVPASENPFREKKFFCTIL
ncbi:hypothetical protein PFLUV_G00225310 [Perca fluviatilis]|uniref:Guanine nucleotide-binding protein subunit gamma n=2 Tax=Perca TaxID=8166 RepID=A0A6A5E5S4_PERFL|nr:hypothetical protein PFLUV_G00225310 [Perca fluviatilis]